MNKLMFFFIIAVCFKIIKFTVIFLFVLGVIISMYVNKTANHNLKFMDLHEIIYLNMNLYLIKKSGLIYLNKSNVKIQSYLSKDRILIKFFRTLEKKYGKAVETYVGTQKNIFVLDPQISAYILNNSPYLFNAGKLKEKFFNKIMPYNVGISKCDKGVCPWKKRRHFYDKLLWFRK
jgi:hypothetical protein